MKVSFPFYNLNGVLRPWIPVRYANHDGSIVTNVFPSLIDTGADQCTLPKAISDICRYDLKTGTLGESQGIHMDKVITWQHPFSIQLMSPNLKEVLWQSPVSPIRVVDHSRIPPILGFNEFISNFNLTINQKANQIILELHQSLDEKMKGVKKMGANEPCFCGSGKKFKRCHGVTS